jgi:iron complex outermembrane recepter protein
MTITTSCVAWARLHLIAGFGRILGVSGLALSLQFTAASAVAGTVLDRTIQIDIPANTLLETALVEWGVKAGVTVMINTHTVGSRTTQGVKGTLTARRALSLLLRASGLSYSEDGGRVRVVPTAGAAVPGRPEGYVASSANSDFSTLFASDNANDAGGAASAARPSDLQEVVVTAQKREERLQDVPISISVLTGAALDKSSVVGVADALTQVPGVSVNGGSGYVQGGGMQIAIRGVTAAVPILGGSSPIAYYLDGLPFALDRSAIAPDADTYDLDRVEVLRGPQGTLYGAGGENGVVRVLTQDADLNDFDFKARTAVSTTDSGGENYRGDMAVNIPIIEGKLAARAVVGDENMSGWIDSPVKNNVNDSERRNVRLKIDAQPTDDLTIAASAWHSESDYGAPAISLPNGTITVVDPEPTAIDYSLYGLRIAYNFALVSVSSTTSYLIYSSANQLDLSGQIAALPDGPGSDITTDLSAHTFSEEFVLNSRLQGPWRWTAGLAYRDGEDRHFENGAVFEEPINYSFGSKSYAVFGELSRSFLNNAFEWTLGARYFHDDEYTTALTPDLVSLIGLPPTSASATSKATTPRAVLTWHPNTDLTVYGSFSQGFRSGFPQNPSVIETEPTFPSLKPDKLSNYEVGTKGSLFDQRLTFDAAAYYVYWHGVQQELNVPFGPLGAYVDAFVNGQAASGPGLEFAITTHPVGGFDLGVNFGWNDLTMNDNVLSQGAILYAKGGRLNASPEYTGGAFAEYAFPLGGTGFKGHFSASGYYTSEQDTHYINGTAGAIQRGDNILVTRVALGIDAPSHWTVTAYVDNLNNERGTPLVYPDPSLQWSQRIRPRTAGLQLDYHFKD